MRLSGAECDRFRTHSSICPILSAKPDGPNRRAFFPHFSSVHFSSFLREVSGSKPPLLATVHVNSQTALEAQHEACGKAGLVLGRGVEMGKEVVNLDGTQR